MRHHWVHCLPGARGLVRPQNEQLLFHGLEPAAPGCEGQTDLLPEQPQGLATSSELS